jgi:hypothetical protein
MVSQVESTREREKHPIKKKAPFPFWGNGAIIPGDVLAPLKKSRNFAEGPTGRKSP